MTEVQYKAIVALKERLEKNPTATHASISMDQLFHLIALMNDLKQDFLCMEWLEHGGCVTWSYGALGKNMPHAGTPSSSGSHGVTVRQAILSELAKTKS